MECMNPVNMIARTHALFIPALRQSNLQSQGTDAISWALDKKYDFENDENDMDKIKLKECMKRVCKEGVKAVMKKNRKMQQKHKAS